MIKILTPDGWSEFKTVQRKLATSSLVSLEFSDGSYLSGTKDHLIKDGNTFVSMDSVAPDHKIGGLIVENRTELDVDFVYDVVQVDKKNQYITNSVVSHNCEFRGSTDSLLSGDVLERIPRFEPVIYGDLKIYDEPVKGHEYFITVDTSRGVGGDYSAFIVFDITEVPYQVVAVYKNNRIPPSVYPQIIRNIADKYNKAHILVEINDIGEQVAFILQYDFEYDNMIMCFSDKQVQRIGFVNDARVGVRTTTQVKSIGISTIKTMVESGKIAIKDEDLIDEFGNFIPKGKSYEAAEGSHDDLVMCCVLFAWASVQQYFIELVDKDIKRDMQASMINQYMDDLLPFGFIDDGLGDVYNPQKMMSIY